MRFRPITWLLLSLLLFLAGGLMWQYGQRQLQLKRAAGSGPSAQPAAPASGPQSARPHLQPAGAAQIPPALASQFAQTNLLAAKTNRFRYRLTNTTKSVNELARSEKAILLENALIDTAQSAQLRIPAELRSQGDPGSYIVQSRGALDDAYRALLQASGAEIISYIPVNAYLVRADAAAAAHIAESPRTLAVLPYEPYYKIKYSLLTRMLDGKKLPADSLLSVLVYQRDRAATEEQLAQLGVTVRDTAASPFGDVLVLGSANESVAAVAGLPGVMSVELVARRAVANDLSRVRLGVAQNTLIETNYYDLSGQNVTVAVADTGVSPHPDFGSRLTGNTLTDPDGHGTHVAGIIAGDGLQSLTVSNGVGSINPGTNGQYRGKAPKANLLSLGIDFDLPFVADANLQEAAVRTNASIVNNSWGFVADHSYNLVSASYDAAVRDALPGTIGSQPLVYVFSAGNDGIGDDNGVNGEADTISAPATAKNVISVGAIESARFITNDVIFTNFVSGGVFTNKAFLGSTDSSNQVASFSSRGNVGIGVEGDFGRFKPDVVAPGTMIVSTRSANWNEQAYYTPTNIFLFFALNQTIKANSRFDDFLFLPNNTVRVDYDLIPNDLSPTPFPNLSIYARPDQVPVPPADFQGINSITIDNPNPVNTFWFFTALNPTNIDVAFDEVARIYVTNAFGDYFQVLSNLNSDLGPDYRYETGTSMAAPAISGVLALLQDFFSNKLGQAASPALLKAMLINGARNVNSGVYDFEVRNNINYQGWGVANLTNSLPSATVSDTTLLTSSAGSPLKIFEQDPTNALATGQQRTWEISLSPRAQNRTLRFTLVWTDPPGNPIAGLKLVNDLDLIVTNLYDTNEVFFGNDIQAISDFNQPWDGETANIDFVNNVENVYLQAPLTGSRYSVTVLGRRVNVNAVTAHTNVVQDYALVISSGNGTVADAISIDLDSGVVFASSAVTNSGTDLSTFPYVTTVPDGVPLLDQTVGANAPLLSLTTITNENPGVATNGLITLGLTNQWHFYVFTNTGVNSLSGTNNATNVAFITFSPPTLSLPRIGTREQLNPDNASRFEADIDLYVSKDSNLLNLDPATIAAADKSISREGTEFIVYSNEPPGLTYYIGIKSEDQQAATYGFFGIATDQPFSQTDSNGNVTVRGLPTPMIIPDGTPMNPGAALVFGIVPTSLKVRRVVVTNDTEHELFGDLLGNLSHRGQFSVLNNHTSDDDSSYFKHLVYEDNGEGGIPDSRYTDGPGSLRGFVGEEGSGVWLFTMVDNAQSQTGRVDNFRLWIQPSQNTNDLDTTITICDEFFSDSLEVGPQATNLTFTVDNTGGGPVDLYVRFDDFVDIANNAFDFHLAVPAGVGGKLVIDASSNPPLRPGRYFFSTVNPNVDCFTLRFQQFLDSTPVAPNQFTVTGAQPLFDDAVNNSTQSVTNRGLIFSTEVGLRIDHPRISDLAITLVSPQGTRVLLSENRGGNTTEGMGLRTSVTNIVVQDFDSYFTFTEDLGKGMPPSTTPIKYYVPPFRGTSASELFFSGFESVVAGSYASPGSLLASLPEDGWVVDSNTVEVISDAALAHSGTNLLSLADGQVSNTLPTIAGRRYVLNYAYLSTNALDEVAVSVAGAATLTNSASASWQGGAISFTATTNGTPVLFTGIGAGVWLDSIQVVELGEDAYALPEESLAKLKGETVFGEWRLELWDNRVGPPAPVDAALLSWQLSFILDTSPVSNPISNPVSNMVVTATNTVSANSFTNLEITVPFNAVQASNVLLTADGPLDGFFNLLSPNTGDTNAGDFQWVFSATSGLLVLNYTSAPPLLPGSTYYLGFSNGTASDVTFVVQVDFALGTIFGAPPVFQSITFDTNGFRLLQWTNPPDRFFLMQWATNVTVPMVWNLFTNVITTNTTDYQYLDDGSLSGNSSEYYYRLQLLP